MYMGLQVRFGDNEPIYFAINFSLTVPPISSEGGRGVGGKVECVGVVTLLINFFMLL